MRRGYKIYGTILGAIIMLAALILIIYSFIDPNIVQGTALYVGISAFAIGAIIIGAAWKG